MGELDLRLLSLVSAGSSGLAHNHHNHDSQKLGRQGGSGLTVIGSSLFQRRRASVSQLAPPRRPASLVGRRPSELPPSWSLCRARLRRARVAGLHPGVHVLM